MVCIWYIGYTSCAPAIKINHGYSQYLGHQSLFDRAWRTITRKTMYMDAEWIHFKCSGVVKYAHGTYGTPYGHAQ